MTPREFYREQAAALQRWKDRLERDITHAWHVAAFAGQMLAGKMESLQTVITNMRRGSRRQTADEMHAQIATLSKLSGFPMKLASAATLAKLKRAQPHA